MLDITTMGKRDEFNKPTIEALAKRVSFLCSNPICKRTTIGPHSNPEKSTLIGVAAHITAAAAGGPRYNANLSESDRKSIENGIWLCETCARIIDKDPDSYPVALLDKWKKDSENESLGNLTNDSSVMNNNISRPIIEVDLIYGNSGRSPRGYAEENFGDGERVIQAGQTYIQFWDLSWNHKLVLMNNSSVPAFHISIEQVEGVEKPYIEPIPKLNNIPPYANIETLFKYKEFYKGTYKEADGLIYQTIPPSLDNVKLKITYKNEAREEFETIVQFNNGEVENII
ncbi:MAG: hypothetical protein COA31_007590 [Flavobacteriales bacterium]|nr:hypothetical protein [Flavobacteriales bacterium]